MNKLEVLGCVEITSQKQADNGTICYYDPQTKVYYMLYENGYVRRSFGRHKKLNGRWSNEAIYQLNPKGKGTYTSPHSGRTIPTTIRVMLNTHDERMDCAASGVVNYRNTLKTREFDRAARINRIERNISMKVLSDCVSQYFEGVVNFETTVNHIKETLNDIKSKGLA